MPACNGAPISLFARVRIEQKLTRDQRERESRRDRGDDTHYRESKCDRLNELFAEQR